MLLLQQTEEYKRFPNDSCSAEYRDKAVRCGAYAAVALESKIALPVSSTSTAVVRRPESIGAVIGNFVSGGPNRKKLRAGRPHSAMASVRICEGQLADFNPDGSLRVQDQRDAARKPGSFAGHHPRSHSAKLSSSRNEAYFSPLAARGQSKDNLRPYSG